MVSGKWLRSGCVRVPTGKSRGYSMCVASKLLTEWAVVTACKFSDVFSAQGVVDLLLCEN